MRIHIILGLILCLFFSIRAQYTTVAIIGTNDIHGSAFPKQMQKGSNSTFIYNYGGLAYMGGLIDIIKSQYPGHTLFLDSGDQFQGGVQSSPEISQGRIMNDFYDALDLQASAIGNHEFDFGPEILLPFMQSKKANVAANIRSQKGQSEFLPQQTRSKLFELSSGIRIGVIGLTTTETNQTTSAFDKKLFPDYKFLEYKQVVINESRRLRRSGADAVIVTAHVGNDCNANNTYGNWTINTNQTSCAHDEVSKLIDELPTGTIDGFMQGHRHKFAHHFYKGIPYVGSINGGYYFNVLYLKFHKKDIYQKIIEGPIPVCEKVFQNLGRCDYIPPNLVDKTGDLVNWKFHGQDVKPNAKVLAILEQVWRPKMDAKGFFKNIGNSDLFLTSLTDAECELANLITYLIHDTTPTPNDFVIINPGGLRTDWTPGPIQEQHLYNMLPFDNKIISFQINGNELLKMLEILQNGTKGFYPTYGISQTVSIQKLPNNMTKRSFINATWLNGSAINRQQNYRGVSIDFLVKNKGDDFINVMNKVYTLRNDVEEGEIKAMIRGKLATTAINNNNPEIMINPEKPRLRVLSK